MLTSARTALNVNQLFSEIAHLLFEKVKRIKRRRGERKEERGREGGEREGAEGGGVGERDRGRERELGRRGWG